MTGHTYIPNTKKGALIPIKINQKNMRTKHGCRLHIIKNLVQTPNDATHKKQMYMQTSRSTSTRSSTNFIIHVSQFVYLYSDNKFGLKGDEKRMGTRNENVKNGYVVIQERQETK